MPARCIRGFLFEDDLISVTLHARLTSLEPSEKARKLGALRSLEERWRIHYETCPRCSRLDTNDEACLREEYKWKRAQFHGSLSSDASRLPSSSLSTAVLRQAGLSSPPTRQLLGELESLRRQLLNH